MHIMTSAVKSVGNAVKGVGRILEIQLSKKKQHYVHQETHTRVESDTLREKEATFHYTIYIPMHITRLLMPQKLGNKSRMSKYIKAYLYQAKQVTFRYTSCIPIHITRFLLLQKLGNKDCMSETVKTYLYKAKRSKIPMHNGTFRRIKRGYYDAGCRETMSGRQGDIFRRRAHTSEGMLQKF